MALPEGTPAERGAARAARSEQVLVVDDEATVRRFACRVLQEEGFAVHEAGDGLEAIGLLDSGVIPDCVLSDVVMPRLDGVRLMEALALRHPGLPVILMSAYSSAQLVDRGISAPCGVLAKPFTPERLVEEVRRCLADWS